MLVLGPRPLERGWRERRRYWYRLLGTAICDSLLRGFRVVAFPLTVVAPLLTPLRLRLLLLAFGRWDGWIVSVRGGPTARDHMVTPNGHGAERDHGRRVLELAMGEFTQIVLLERRDLVGIIGLHEDRLVGDSVLHEEGGVDVHDIGAEISA